MGQYGGAELNSIHVVGYGILLMRKASAEPAEGLSSAEAPVYADYPLRTGCGLEASDARVNELLKTYRVSHRTESRRIPASQVNGHDNRLIVIVLFVTRPSA